MKGGELMRKWTVEYANDENWEKHHKCLRVEACTLRGALKRAYRKIPKGTGIYQILTRIKGCELEQPVWDFFNQEYICPKSLLGKKRKEVEL